MSDIAKELAEVVPSNWCDPLLTGPSRALTRPAGSWGCDDIERLLNGIRERIQNHAALAAMVADSERLEWLLQNMRCEDFCNITGRVQGDPQYARAAIDNARGKCIDCSYNPGLCDTHDTARNAAVEPPK